MKKKRIILLIILILLGIVYVNRSYLLNLWQDLRQPSIPQSVSKNEAISKQTADNSNLNQNFNINHSSRTIVLPAEFNLSVPFTTQSPFAEWTEQDNESCEEAAILIVHYYWQGKTFTKEIAKKELQKIIDFEMDYFGFYKDTDAEQTAELARKMWGYKKVDVIWQPSLEDIKRQVYAGRPVIVPTAGRELNNPNFRRPGPLYHMLVIRGWNKKNIITNDPGTRHGENFQYPYDVLYGAIHDWNGGDIYHGKKVMIVFYPNE